MKIIAEIGVSGLIMQDKREPDAWRVYYQGRLTAPRFACRRTAHGYLSALRLGQRVAEFVRGEGEDREVN
jgi:hypothetical protein